MMDSRLRGNDGGESGNDGGESGNDGQGLHCTLICSCVVSPVALGHPLLRDT